MDGQVSTVGNFNFETNYSNIAKDRERASVSTELLYIVMVLTMVDESHSVCTGCLIKNNMVLTLASCLIVGNYKDPDPDTIFIYERPIGMLRALEVIINSNYYSKDRYFSKAHNFAVIHVERSKQTVYPQLPLSMDKFEGIKHTCVMGGYGSFGNVGRKNFKLIDVNKSQVDIVESRPCLDGKSVCLYFNDSMPCAEDRGSPMICNGVLYAMYSPRQRQVDLSNKCYNIYITPFTYVYNIEEWLNQIINKPTSSFEWLSNPWYVLLLCVVVFLVMGSIYYVLMEFLQWKFDPAEGFDNQMHLSGDSVLSLDRRDSMRSNL